MTYLNSERSKLDVTEYVYDDWYDGFVDGYIHCRNLGWHYLWLVGDSHFCELRIYRTVPMTIQQVFILRDLAMQLTGCLDYSCLDREHRVLTEGKAMIAWTPELDSIVDPENWDKFEEATKTFTDNLVETGESNLRYLASHPYMYYGTWLSRSDVPDREFEQSVGQSYWDALTADLVQKS